MPDQQSDRKRAVRIAGRPIGSHYPTFVVAEAGVNHNGCVETALRMVDAAANAGADAVKFQMFCAQDLATKSAPTAAYQRKNSGQQSQRDMLERLELSMEAFGRIQRHCETYNVLFLATPFGPADVERLAGLGVSAIKIASTDLTNLPLLEAAASTRLPMIVSTGAATEDEIRKAVDQLQGLGAAERLILLHCVSAYPTPVESANLRAIRALHDALGLPTGLSDHTTSVAMGGLAVAAGACVVEKHFTLDADATGPDHFMSLSADRLAEYIEGVREADAAMGTAALGMTEIESGVREVARKSVVAAVDIPAGCSIEAEMLALKRPGTGIAPAELAKLLGRTSLVDIPPDTMLSWEMIR